MKEIALESQNEVSWLKLWDAMLDEGIHGTVRLQSLYKVITWPKVATFRCAQSVNGKAMYTHLLPHLLEINLQGHYYTVLTSASTRDIYWLLIKFTNLKTVMVPSFVLATIVCPIFAAFTGVCNSNH